MAYIISGVLFFVLGILVTYVGYIWGLGQAFREEFIWGVLYFVVPFAGLVFYLKKWSNQKIRKSFLIQLSGWLVTFVGYQIAALGGLQNFVPNLSSTPPVPDVNISASTMSSASPIPPDFGTFPESSQSPSPVDAAFPVTISTRKYDFKQSMQLGYEAYKLGEYQTALINFNRALQERPGNAYAVKAISNTKTAIAQNPVK
ncbi:tetratricopeptide repeat protein [Microcoleus sp. LEGE 07076]|uniref:tetratricopeptide repeat protein n=1 Tax=Microcoleus sp. LEGE 07076 TaxID=915322 RepID=UPI001880815A|nr:tetratricopeptide repeat protein [Microcoleus sp. LEGE 07076]MBE9184916.1 tetratricopeptide repeat protein [Microcoleus sp. LEGE 07076]